MEELLLWHFRNEVTHSSDRMHGLEGLAVGVFVNSTHCQRPKTWSLIHQANRGRVFGTTSNN